jgi:hypothetical protein
MVGDIDAANIRIADVWRTVTHLIVLQTQECAACVLYPSIGMVSVLPAA